VKKSPIQTVTNIESSDFYHSIGGVTDISVLNSAAEEYGAVFTGNASLWGQDFSNLTTNLSGRPGLTRGGYEQFRPHERVPMKHKDIVKFAQQAYEKVGLIRNIVDLMGDFACQGIRVSCANKRDERFYRNWFKKVGGPERSERFTNNLYRTGNIIIRRQTARLDLKQRSGFFKANGKPDIKLEKDSITKAEIPIKYTFLNPCVVDLIGEQLACFTDKKQYCITLPANFRNKINNAGIKLEEKKLLENLPPEILNAIKTGGTYLLPEDKTLVFHYKKDDWQPWAFPMTYSIFDDIILLEKHKLADSTALDGAISNIRLWKLGHIGTDEKNRILPGKGASRKLREILESHTAGGTIDLVWDAAIELVESKTEVYKFLGKDKYEPTLASIYGGIGIPSTLVGTGEGGTTNNFISLKTLIQRLEYGREILLQFWTKELEIVQKAMGLEPAIVEFDYMDLGDPSTQNNLLIALSDRGLMSDELLQHKFKHNPTLEDARIKRENEERTANTRAPKAGPFYEAEPLVKMKHTALQKGYVKPQDVGVNLKEVAENVRDKTKPKPLSPAKKGVSGQGRPKNSKDSVKRKAKKFTPRTKASIELWASTAQDKIAEILNPMILQSFGKKNMRSLTDEESQVAEKIKFGVLFNVGPFQTLDKAYIGQAFLEAENTPQELYDEYNRLHSEAKSDLGRNLTFDEIRRIQTYLYGEIYNSDED
jgi:hypothetical protein